MVSSGKLVDYSASFTVDDGEGEGGEFPRPALGPQSVDAHRLNQRQKQVDFGKNTLGYERYLELVPR